jgi:hypothetical protein
MTDRLANLVHIGRKYLGKRNTCRLFLRKISPHSFEWFEGINDSMETNTGVAASTIEEAIRLANWQWKNENFTTLHCGFRYTLPERDEHGINALFCQMIASYSTPTGVYYDEELGCNCFVQNASIESRNLWKSLAGHATVQGSNN